MSGINWSVSENEISLRDYFAAKAMQGFAALPDGFGFSTMEQMAKCAYDWADTMLKVREK